MKMNFLKFLSVLCITAIFGQTGNAQTYNGEVELFQSLFGMQKKEIVAEFLNIDDNDTFWPMYDEYETKRQQLGKERMVLLLEYVENYDVLDNENYDILVADMISLRKGTDKLMDQYYKKIKKTSGSKKAAQFFQIEGYFLSEIRTSIFEGIPLIGEFED